MFHVSVRSHIMIAHSLPDDFFGPAAALHGATYVIDAELRRPELDSHNVVVDIGEVHGVLDEVAASLSFRNLDDDPRFDGALTTTEYLARFIHGEVASRLDGVFEGFLKITLEESHVARAGYEGPVG